MVTRTVNGGTTSPTPGNSPSRSTSVTTNVSFNSHRDALPTLKHARSLVVVVSSASTPRTTLNPAVAADTRARTPVLTALPSKTPRECLASTHNVSSRLARRGSHRVKMARDASSTRSASVTRTFTRWICCSSKNWNKTIATMTGRRQEWTQTLVSEGLPFDDV